MTAGTCRRDTGAMFLGLACVVVFGLVLAFAPDVLARSDLEGQTSTWLNKISSYLLHIVGPGLLVIAIIVGAIMRFTSDDPTRGNTILKGCLVGGFLLVVANAAKSFLLAG